MSFEIRDVQKSWLAPEPKIATTGSTGCDLFAAEDYGPVHPRSSLARYHFIDIGRGVIDSDFWGELIMIMFNHSNKPYKVKMNDRIAQIIFHRYEIPKFVECSELPKIDRVREVSAPQAFKIL